MPRSRGRPKGSRLTAIGLAKAKKQHMPQCFVQKTATQQVRGKIDFSQNLIVTSFSLTIAYKHMQVDIW